MWLLVPLILTQGYLFGLIIDYNRFLYFLLLPVLVLFGMFLDHGSLTFSRIIDTYRTLTSQLSKTNKSTNKYAQSILKHLSRKNLYVIFVSSILVVSFFLIPLFVNPSEGLAIGNFYQVMDKPGYQGIQWAKDNSPVGSVFVSDALYGWWLGGFSQRPTISAVDPQYLTGTHELNPAKNASLLLDTDYMIDNGYIQVREDGGYLARHNPEILTKLNWTYFPYSFFNFNSNQVEILYKLNGSDYSSYLSDLPVKNMQLQINPANNDTTIIVSRGNNFFNYTEFTTVYQGLPFVNMTISVDSSANDFSINYIMFNDVESKGEYIQITDSSVSWVDQGVKAFGQLIFKGSKPDIHKNPTEGPPFDLRLEYSFGESSKAQFQIIATTFSVTDTPQYYQNKDLFNEYFDNLTANNLNTQLQQNGNATITTFDYQTAIQYYNVSYIANRAADINSKFASDPAFSLVFINDKVSIFKIEANAYQVGR